MPQAPIWSGVSLRFSGLFMIVLASMRWSQGLGWVLLAWCGGIALQLQQAALWPFGAYAALGVLALGIAWGLRVGGAKRLGSSLSGLRVLSGGLVWAMLAFTVTGLHALSRAELMNPALEGQDLDVVGVVQAMPQRQDLGWRFRFGIEQAWQVDKSGLARSLQLPAELPTQVYLGWYGQEGTDDSGWNTSALPEPVKAGERWRLRVRLKAPHGNMNPRGFDYELWLWEQGIQATGYVRTGIKDPAPQRVASTWLHPIEGWRQAVRDRLLTHLSHSGSAPLKAGSISPDGTSPGPESAQKAKLAGIVAALVTGDQAAIDRSDWDVFRATGVAHLMSISGLHVTMFAWLASGLVAWGWRKSALWGFAGALHWPAAHAGALTGLILAGLYALFSGWGVPSQRTLWMLSVVVVLKISAREWPKVLIWLLAGALVLSLDPWAMLQAGFWLSFVAVGVLMASEAGQQRHPDEPLLSTDLVQKSFRHRLSADAVLTWGRKGVQAGWGLMREQGTITLALAPLTLLFFGQVSLVGLLANLFAIPWVTLVVTPLAMLGVIWSGAWDLAALALQPMAALLNWLAAWPMASISTAMPPWGFAALALAGALGLVLKLPLSWKLMCLPCLLPVFFWAHPRPVAGAFELLAADIGQGNAVLIRTAKHSLLYDTGPRYSAESDAGHRVLVPLLTQMGERINLLMLSHRDSDHTGGAAAVLAMQPQAHLWTSLEDKHPLHGLRPDWTRCETGQSWDWDGVHFEVLHPPSEPAVLIVGPARLPGSSTGSNLANSGRSSAKSIKPNAVSCVLRISNGQTSALLAGDIEAEQELALVDAGLARVHLLLVPHHGSKTSSTQPFLQALQPRLALVQAGYRNRYGHPAEPVVARYRARGIELIESTRCGAAAWRSQTPNQVQCERVQSRRYWHHIIPP